MQREEGRKRKTEVLFGYTPFYSSSVLWAEADFRFSSSSQEDEQKGELADSSWIVALVVPRLSEGLSEAFLD